MYGHSAGGQFAHRTAIFSRSEYIDYVIAANPGSYTFLDETSNYSSGIKNLTNYKSTILSNLSRRKLYILTGNKDNDPNADNFTPSEQGNSRYEKALNFCKSTLSYAVENKVYYNWETLIMDGVDHTASKTIPYVLDIITGKYQSKTEQINERITETEIIKGDLNGDGTADIADAQIYLEYLVGNTTLTDNQLSAVRLAAENYDNDDSAIRKLRKFLQFILQPVMTE